MSANLEAKKVQVSEISEKLSKAQSVVILDYKGLTVEQDTELRNRFRKAGVEYKVIKNTLFSRSAMESKVEGFDTRLEGTSSFAFGYEDAAVPAKVANDFIKEMKKMSLKGGILNGRAVDAASIQALADLPPRDILIAQVLGTLNAPIAGFARVLSGTLTSLLYALNAVKEQKEN